MDKILSYTNKLLAYVRNEYSRDSLEKRSNQGKENL